MIHRFAVMLIGLLGLASLAAADDLPSQADEYDYFERKIRPLLSQHCYSCHSTQAKTVHGGLRLDSASGLEQGGDSGSAVVAGDPDTSLLIEAVRYDGGIQMPPEGKLPGGDIEKLVRWIKAGAHFPPSSDQPERRSDEIDYERGRKFWSFQPVRRLPLPEVNDEQWPRQRIDYFTLSAMERQGLKPSSPANRATLVRRLYFAVTGLPPSPQQVRSFQCDRSPDAYRRLVDRILASPQYGQRWGRWWLDMARYTDRTASWLYQAGQAHRYRDWVVGAINDDLAYDEFVCRQLATDLMSETGPEDLPALGFLSLSPTYWKELKLPCEIIKVIVADEWEERVDAVSRTFIGLTVACARCHDHKYDPISSEDYYALAGIFASCRQVERPLISADAYEPVRIAKDQVAKLQAEVAKLKKEKPQPKKKLEELAAKITNIKTSTPLYNTPMANALSEESMYVVRKGESAQDGTRLDYRAEPRDLPAFIRGNPNRPGPIVRRRFLKVLAKDAVPYTQGSGRLELAQSIITDAAPLAARVIVNRLWLEHFGRGIVSTPSDFGRQGSPPTHPELLSDLAARFIEDGWSLKKLHREILLSATWRQSSAGSDRSVDLDPENLWLSRMNPRRLSFEQWRDAMLLASGELDSQMDGPSLKLDAADNHRRTIYATVHRRDMSPTLMIHDFPDPTQHSPQRTSTVTALQGLYALNGPLLLSQAQQLATRLSREAGDDRRRQIRRAYWLLFSKEPDEIEVEEGLAFVGQPVAVRRVGEDGQELQSADKDSSVRWQQYLHVLFASNEFLFVD